MKNLLIYVGPTKQFSPEYEALTKMQIDNSLGLGWSPEDIILVTDFPWEYQKVKTHVLPEGEYDALDGNRSSKIPVILQLFREGMVNDLFWFHDHDAFQLEPLPILEVEDAVFTDHGWWKMWNAGSFFFNSKSESLFKLINDTMLKNKTNEQTALTTLWDSGTERNLLNITYNLGIYHLKSNLEKANKPYMVAHFHPHKPKHLALFRDILPDRLLKIFAQYGIR